MVVFIGIRLTDTVNERWFCLNIKYSQDWRFILLPLCITGCGSPSVLPYQWHRQITLSDILWSYNSIINSIEQKLVVAEPVERWLPCVGLEGSCHWSVRWVSWFPFIPTYLVSWRHSTSNLGGGADKSSARPTSRCRRTESIVSLEREVCSCAELQVFSRYRGWKEEGQATRMISTTSRGELSSSFFPPCKARRRRKFTPFWKKH